MCRCIRGTALLSILRADVRTHSSWSPFESVFFRNDSSLVVPALVYAGEFEGDRVGQERRGKAGADAVHYPSVAKVTPAARRVSTTILSTLLSTLIWLVRLWRGRSFSGNLPPTPVSCGEENDHADAVSPALKSQDRFRWKRTPNRRRQATCFVGRSSDFPRSPPVGLNHDE